jgi:thiamine pyrophosphate-dependent acetolactate synthase large subunit-like protein
MKRLNLEGNDITETQVAWDESDRVDLSGFEYDKLLARLEAAAMTVQNLKELFEALKKKINDDKGGIVVVDHIDPRRN